MTEPLTINMQSHAGECFVCGEPADPLKGIPVYEDIVRWNESTEDWAGQPACPRCHHIQSLMVGDMTVAQLQKLLPFWRAMDAITEKTRKEMLR